MKKKKIRVIENGPYIVTGKISLDEQIIGVNKEGDPDKWIQGKKYPLRDNYALCRCGWSQKKPFCDDSHLTVSFVGTETATRELYVKQAKETEGPTLKLFDVPILCALARFCDRAGGTWELTRQSDNLESRENAIEETGDCPSGRLVITDKKTGERIEPNFKPSISIVEDPQKNVNGPIWVKGKIPIESADGLQYEIRNRVTLCRCGKSSNKPFCNGNHVHT